jgi:hypothetical protein
VFLHVVHADAVQVVPGALQRPSSRYSCKRTAVLHDFTALV